MEPSTLESHRRSLEQLSPDGVLAWAATTFGDQVVLATSLGAEDQVLTHFLDRGGHAVSAFMLDTGRHFEETHDLLERTLAAFSVDIQLYFPRLDEVEAMVNEDGPYGFRKDVALRKKCCAVRKMEPLQRALAGRAAWITGLRRDQAQTRGQVQVLEWDSQNELVKINPLWNWQEDEVWQFIRENDVPYNALHDAQFPSIGCAPCTRAVKPGEDVRAGRWWWERPEQKECGLHWVDGRLVRAKEQQSTPQPLFEEVSS